MSPTIELRTTPSGIHIAYYDKSHRYKIGREAGDLGFVPSVSTVLDGSLPKQLSGWAERGAILGVQTLASLGRPVAGWGPDAILAEMHANGLRYYQRRDAAALRGTSVHNAFEQLSHGKAPKLADYPLGERGYVQGIARWWSEYQPSVLHAELMVASIEHGYAGRMDLLAALGDDVAVIDLKTSKAVRESHHFQTAAYRLAVEESGYPTATAGYVLRVGEDGTYEMVKSWATAHQFLALHKSYLAQKEFTKATPAEYKPAKVKEKAA